MEKQLKYTIIKNLAQYTEYCDRHESLVHEDEVKYTDEIELLELLIEAYDQQNTKETGEEPNPVELLRSLLQDANITQSELSKSIEVSKQLISDILGYRRGISKDVMIKLSSFFSMNVAAFSREYDLISNRNNLNTQKGRSRQTG